MNIAQETLSDRAHAMLRGDIVSGRLPPETRLRIAQLSETYGIGASPLREALSKLTAEFLVIFEAQRGFSVAPVSAEELRDISRVRCDLESEALQRAIAAGDDSWEAGIVAAFYALGKADSRRRENPSDGASDWEDKNRAFHEALVAACESPWLKRLRGLIYYQHERYRRISLTHPDPARDLQAEHQAIMDATLARDTPTAIRLSNAHIDRTTQAVLKVIA
ncbi:GntR family transcriptional regulator [Oceanicola sp. 502str15]|uniref:GntR family transcriptional regulator n=1 Tax=Oceanicola sp. 502str15 TaxID=2696061 RepID=UPI002094B6FC|nr:FCD domain-containing protein [Oceanicola sp. 502str15]MCO6383487.1 FCD domain-containing protein [Oceanicola sp. 502str15]